jgi:hypothetical protein
LRELERDAIVARQIFDEMPLRASRGTVLDEEEAKAWDLSFFPHLFLPDLVEAHIARLGLEPADASHNNILACHPTSRKSKNHQLSPAYAAGRHEMLATSPT